ncbi:MAG TPA: hypothetical protein VKY65_14660 [Alphaproteobacteria bacterium]|nr:hypothetical protein [Alphaproteobacteria bacterium]
MNNDSIILLAGQTSNTTGSTSATEFPFIGPVNGTVVVTFSGPFGGGTASLESYDGLGNWAAVPGSSLSAAGAIALTAADYKGLRVKLTGAAGANLIAVAVINHAVPASQTLDTRPWRRGPLDAASGNPTVVTFHDNL